MRRTSVVTLLALLVFASVVSADSTVYLPVLTATKGATRYGVTSLPFSELDVQQFGTLVTSYEITQPVGDLFGAEWLPMVSSWHMNHLDKLPADYSSAILFLNEPNDSKQDPMSPCHGVALASTVRATFPDAYIVGANVSQHGLWWLTDFMACGGGEYIDAVGVHFYRIDDSALQPDYMAELEAVYATASAYGFPVWLTEYGVVGRYREADHRAMNDYIDGRFAVALWFSLTANVGGNSSSTIFGHQLITRVRQSQGIARTNTSAGATQCEHVTGAPCEFTVSSLD